MRHNRIFRRRGYRISSLRLSLRNVSCTAKQWGFLFALRVQPEILRNYTVPRILDDEGYYLVGRIVMLVDAVLQGRLRRRLVSHGKYLSFEFKLWVQHRRRATEEILELQILIGPCDGRRPVAYVWLIEPVDSPPF